MKIAMLILGIIGSLIALVGGLVTIVSGAGGTLVGVAAEHAGVATSGAYVFWSGVIAIAAGTLALIFSIVGGVAKKKNVILIFAMATLACGLLNVYLYNWFSGLLIAVGGGLGCAGAKDGIDEQKPVLKSPMLYIIFAGLLVLTGAAMLFKNGKALVGNLDSSHISPSSSSTSQVKPAPETAPNSYQSTPTPSPQADNSQAVSGAKATDIPKFKEIGQWGSGWGQGVSEYGVTTSKGDTLYIACSKDRPVSMMLYVNGVEYGPYSKKPFSLIIDGTEIQTPYETASRVGADNFIFAWDALRKAKRLQAKTVDGKLLDLPTAGANKVLPPNNTPDNDCKTAF